METVFTLLSWVASLASLVLFIIVLIRLFQVKGALHGILGLICSLYTFIWGWMVAKEQNLTNIMIAWTAAILLSLVFYFLGGGAVGA